MTEMTLEQLQEHCESLLVSRGWSNAPEDRLGILLGEVQELSEAVNSGWRHGGEKYLAVVHELADVQNALCLLANSLGVRLAEAVDQKFPITEAKHPAVEDTEGRYEVKG